MDFLSMMFGGGGQGWLDAALLIGIFWAALGHPERIRNLIEFRTASILLAISIVIPVLVQLYLLRSQSSSLMPRSDPGMVMYAMAISPILKMIAIILAVDSVTPRQLSPYGKTSADG